VTDVPLNSNPAFSLGDFLERLTTGSAIEVGPVNEPMEEIDGAGAAILRGWHEAARDELAGDVSELELDEAAAVWAAKRFYRACQLLVCRDSPPEKMAEIFGPECPSPRNPATDFSVDLIFRFLPPLHDRASRLAPGDPLVTALARWAFEWPLSSPGVRLENLPTLETFAGSFALWRLYVDRVTERRAEDRWRDSRVAARLHADLGGFPEMNAALAESLRRAASVPVTPLTS
jgi:hypothetical protein